MNRPLVYVTRKVPEEALSVLNETADIKMWESAEKPVPREKLLSESKKADAVLSMLSDAIDEPFLEAANNLKVVANLAVGYDNIDVEAAHNRNIVACHTPDVLTDTTADLAFALMMASARRLVEAAELVRENQWKNWTPYFMAGHDIHHKKLGIVGMGRIGTALAKRANGFDMKVAYHNRSRKKEVERDLGVEYMSFDNLLATSDFIVCLTPLTDETKGMFNDEAFGKMKSSAIFVNVSRGAVVDENALKTAIEKGEIAGAGLDVFKAEPIGANHPLLQYPEVVALPHIGSASVETRTAMIQLAAKNIRNVLMGKEPVTPIR